MKTTVCSVCLLLAALMLPTLGLSARETYNFNHQWLLNVGDIPDGEKKSIQDRDWTPVTRPRAINEDEAVMVPIAELTDTVSWYRKHFRLPREARGKKGFVEFEGVRMGADSTSTDTTSGCTRMA